MNGRMIAVGESTTSPASNPRRKQVAVKVYVDEKGWIQNAGFVMKHIPALEKSAIRGPVAIVLHRTVSSTAASTLSAFTRGIGTHFVVDKDGTTYQCASLLKKTAHVGPIRSRCHADGTCTAGELANFKQWTSRMPCYEHEKKKLYPTRYPMNEDSVGIETVAMYHQSTNEWEVATPEQLIAIKRLVGTLKDEYGLTDADIYEHDKIAWKTEGEGAGLYGMPGNPGLQSRLPTP